MNNMFGFGKKPKLQQKVLGIQAMKFVVNDGVLSDKEKCPVNWGEYLVKLDKFFYHGTLMSYYNDMQENGIKIPSGRVNADLPRKDVRAFYATLNKKEAARWPQSEQLRVIITLKIKCEVVCLKVNDRVELKDLCKEFLPEVAWITKGNDLLWFKTDAIEIVSYEVCEIDEDDEN